jgi:hypothetical protein
MKDKQLYQILKVINGFVAQPKGEREKAKAWSGLGRWLRQGSAVSFFCISTWLTLQNPAFAINVCPGGITEIQRPCVFKDSCVI